MLTLFVTSSNQRVDGFESSFNNHSSHFYTKDTLFVASRLLSSHILKDIHSAYSPNPFIQSHFHTFCFCQEISQNLLETTEQTSEFLDRLNGKEANRVNPASQSRREGCGDCCGDNTTPSSTCTHFHSLSSILVRIGAIHLIPWISVYLLGIVFTTSCYCCRNPFPCILHLLWRFAQHSDSRKLGLGSCGQSGAHGGHSHELVFTLHLTGTILLVFLCW